MSPSDPELRGVRTALDARFQAWEVVLDRIELDVIRVERALETGLGLASEPEEWRVPEDYGPIPSALRARAVDVWERQQAALAALATRLGTTAQHQSLVASVEAVRTAADGGPVYVDVAI